MKKQTILLTIMALLSTCGLSLAQSPVGLSVTLGGGLLSPQSSTLKGDISSTYDFPLSRTNYSLFGKVQARIASLPFRIAGTVSYNSLFDNATVPVAGTSGLVNSLHTNSLTLFTVGIGIEYPFLPTSVLDPYLSLAGTMNFVRGNSKYENDIIPESTLNAASRIGLDLGVGTNLHVPLLPLALDLEIKYRFANLLGKEFDNGGIPLPGFGGIPQTRTYNLNDSANPNDASDHDRSINYLTVTLGVSIGIL